MLWLVLAGLGAAVGVLMLRHQHDPLASLSDPDFASPVGKVAILVLIGGAVLTLSRSRFAHVLETLFLWVAVALLLVLGYTYRFELHGVADRVLAELVPGRVATRGREVEVSRARAGDFQVVTQVNGARVPMVLDTGASSVVLTHEAAKAAGLPVEMIKYGVGVETANGKAQAAAVTLDRLAIGNIVERSVPALVTPPGQLKTSLLGMSFLNRLQGWEVRGERLVMRGYP